MATISPSWGSRSARVVAVLKDGTRVSVASRAVSLARVDYFQVVSEHSGYVMDVSPDGRSIAIDATPDVLVVDASSGEVRRRLRGHAEDVWAIRWSDDGRLLAGGFSDLDGTGSYTDRYEGDPRVWDRIERYLTEELGVSARVTHRWVGIVGYTDDLLPFVGEVSPGLYAAGGYSGHGNVLGYLAGQRIARLI